MQKTRQDSGLDAREKPARGCDPDVVATHPAVDAVHTFGPNPVAVIPDHELMREIARALDNPVGAPPLSEIVSADMKVAFCVSDRTRIFPKSEMIEAVLQKIVPPVKEENITFIVAGGNHRPHGPHEAGVEQELVERYRWISHCSTGKDNVYVGATSRRLREFFPSFVRAEVKKGLQHSLGNVGRIVRHIFSTNPRRLLAHIGVGHLGRVGMVALSAAPTRVFLNRAVAEADLVITIGQVKPHYFTGYSGGAKSILPAVASKRTIISNHFMRPHPAANLGIVSGNPIRADMEDAARLLPRVHILNCVLDGNKRPYRFFAGDVVAAHREAARAALQVGGIQTGRFDVVIVSAGPPVSSSMYQFTKVVAPAIRMISEGGVIIAIGDCEEGIGGRFIVNEIIYKLGFQYRLPPKVDIFLISTLPDQKVSSTFFQPLSTVERGLEHARRKLGRPLSVAILEGAGMLLPYLPGEDPPAWI